MPTPNFYENDIKQDEPLTAEQQAAMAEIARQEVNNVTNLTTVNQLINNSTGTPAGSNTQVQFNDGGAFGGDAGLTYNKSTDTLTVGSISTSDAGFTYSGSTLTVGNILGLTSEALDIDAADAPNATSSGLALNLTSGNSGANSGAGGAIGITAGNGVNGAAGDINLTAGDGTPNGGDVNISGGQGPTRGGDVNLLIGNTNGGGTPGEVLIQQNSTGVDIDSVRIVTVASGDNPTLLLRQGRTTTTNATLTTINTIALTASETYFIEARIVARRTGGTAGTAEDGAAYIITGTFKTVGGAATQIGATTTVSSHESQAAWDAQLNVSTTNVLVQIQGAADNNVTWHSHVITTHLSS